MLLTEVKAAELKLWIMKKLENIVDAEPDVLADYVVALVSTDGPDEQIKTLSVDSLVDFLGDKTIPFVSDLFAKFAPPQSQPAHPLSQPAPVSSAPLNPATAPFHPPAAPTPVRSGSIQMAPGAGTGGNMFEGGLQKRKRPYNDEHRNQNYARGDRPTKQVRGGRAGTGNGYGGGDSRYVNRNGFQDFPRRTSMPFPEHMPTMTGPFPPHRSGASTSLGMSTPISPSPFPFDPSDPVAAMMAMQAMGGFPKLPGMPGMPPFPLPQSPVRASSSGPRRLSSSNFPSRHYLKPPCRDYENGACVRGDSCPFEHGTDHLVVPVQNDEYDPAKANILMDMEYSPTGINTNPHPRGNDRGRARGRGRGGQSSGRPRANFSLVGSNEDRSITTIVVEQIPEDNFTEKQVRDFFSKFGGILEITMQPYKHLAIVKFDTYFSAAAAWKSPKPVFENRFVKVYWHKPQSTEKPADLGTVGLSNAVVSVGPPPPIPEPAFDAHEFARQQALAQEAYNEKLRKRQETENARQALDKQKEELRKRQDEEKAKLMAKIAAKAGSNTANSMASGSTPETKEGTRTQALRDQLAALEEEARSIGIDPNAETSQYPRGRGRGRGYRGRGGYPSSGSGYDASFRGGGYRGGYAGGRGRGASSSSVMRLDNRPKVVVVSGVDFDDAKGEALREYLLQLGPFSSITPTDYSNTPSSQSITFADRFVAEKLVYGPPEIPGVGRVEFSWVSSANGHANSRKKGGQEDHDGDTKMGIDVEGESRVEDREGNGGDHGLDVADDDEDGWDGIE